MKGLFAVAGLAVFLVACSDTTIPDSLRQPHVAAKDGIPPPPPLPGSGDGFLDLGAGDAVPAALPNTPPDPCTGIHVPLSYSFDYLQNDPGSNQVSHMLLDGTSGLTGNIDIHQNENGKSNAHGQISGNGFSLNIQSGSENEFDQFFFDFSITAIVTTAAGQKCTLTGDIRGSLFSEPD
jgi:hypothetical protein